MTEKTLPYAGIRVVEFTHMVMGPTCGLVLADLGAEVIKIEPPGGDNTRRLLGSGAILREVLKAARLALEALSLPSPSLEEERPCPSLSGGLIPLPPRSPHSPRCLRSEV